MRPLLEALAGIGQKTITATLTDLPWNHQNFDPYYTMVKHTKNADGTWSHDYSLFDEWVEFAQSCGIGPQIHCYTMVTWGNLVHFIDGATGDRIAQKIIPGSPEHEAFWGPFLTDFEKHVKAKGWLGNVYVAIVERSREELMAPANALKNMLQTLRYKWQAISRQALSRELKFTIILKECVWALLLQNLRRRLKNVVPRGM
jgi:hypothetical protein